MAKKIISALMLLLLCAAPAWAQSKTFLVLLSEVTYEHRASDYTYNGMAVKAAGEFAAEHGVTVDVRGINVADNAAVEPFIGKYDLILAVGNDTCGVVLAAARNNPAQKFALVDTTASDLPENAAAYYFNSREGAFLAGYAAARMAENGSVGFVGGQPFPQVEGMLQSYINGARYAAKDVKVTFAWLHDFFNEPLGYAEAEKLYQQGVDVIFHAAGDSGLGVIKAAVAGNKWVIGVDADQAGLAPENMLTSMVIDIGMAVKDACFTVMENRYAGAVRYVMNLGNNGVHLGKNNVKPEIWIDVLNLQAKIIAGAIDVDLSK